MQCCLLFAFAMNGGEINPCANQLRNRYFSFLNMAAAAMRDRNT